MDVDISVNNTSTIYSRGSSEPCIYMLGTMPKASGSFPVSVGMNDLQVDVHACILQQAVMQGVAGNAICSLQPLRI
jgi:hypothetical protein